MSDRYGWWVVAALFVTLTTSSGLGFYNLAVYMAVLADARQVSVASASGAIAMYFLGTGVAGLAVARLIERFDVRWSIAIGAVCAAAALAAIGVVQRTWQLYALFALFGAGNAGCSLVPATTLVARWFQRRRSVALSITSTGLSVGGVVLTPASAWLLGNVQFDRAMWLIAAAYLLGTVPLALWLVRPWPRGRSKHAGGNRAADGVAYASAVRSRYFIAVNAAYVLIMLSQVGAIAHLYHLVAVRTGPGPAATAMALLAAASIVGRLLGGVWVLRTSTLAFARVNVLLQGASLAWLALAETPAALLGGAVCFGLTVGNLLMLQPLLLAEAFGVRDYGRIYATSQALTMCGVASGPALIGVAFDLAGGYLPAFAGTAAGSWLSIALLRAGGTHAQFAQDERRDSAAAAQ